MHDENPIFIDIVQTTINKTPRHNLGSTTSKKSAGFSICCTYCSQGCYSNIILTLGKVRYPLGASIFYTFQLN